MAVFGVVPGLRIAAPRDAATLREELREAVAVDDGPTIVRFPTGSVAADLPALRRVGRGRRARPRRPRNDVLLVAVGAFGQLGHRGRRAGSPSRGTASPSSTRAGCARCRSSWSGWPAQHRLVVTVEDGVRAGGVGDAIAKTLRDADVTVPLRDLGVPAGLAPARHPRADPGRPRPDRPGRRPQRHRLDLAAGRAGGHARRRGPPRLTDPRASILDSLPAKTGNSRT